MSNFEVKGRRLKYENPWIKVYELAILRDGADGIYGMVERADSAVIIPVSRDGRTVLLKQYRYPTESYSWEFPMGGLDDDEVAEDNATRELSEETGLVPVSLRRIGEFRPIPGLTSQRAAVFVAEVSDEDLDRLQTGPGTYDDEIVDRRVIPVAEFNGLIVAGDVSDGFTLCAWAVFRSTKE